VKSIAQIDGYTPLWFCVRYSDSNEWSLFDSSARLAGFASGAAAAESLGLWQMDYSAATSQMDAIRRAKQRMGDNLLQDADSYLYLSKSGDA